VAVEDIPPRRVRGLGKRLEEIIEATPFYRPSAAEALYGPEPEPVVEEGTESFETTEEEAAEPLPPPTEVVAVDPSGGGNRPDKDSANYGAGPDASTRVELFQWIPTSARGGVVIGDLIVVFRCRKSNPPVYYTYKDRLRDDFDRLKTGTSLGRIIGQGPSHPSGASGITASGNYSRGTKDESVYRALHPTFTGELLTEE
jgi:hypothetical protein